MLSTTLCRLGGRGAVCAVLLGMVGLPWAYAARQHIYLTGTVQSAGTYAFSPSLTFNIQEPGLQELGIITVEGLYNGEYPWMLRVYTENSRYTGVAGALRRANQAGLVSTDGQYVIPIELHSPPLGANVWQRVPDLLESPYVPYRPSDNPDGKEAYTDCLIMGIDPRHAPWVAGPDHKLFTLDDNALGDMTWPTPFAITVRAQVDASAVRGHYEALLYVELVPAP
ncbi:MAG: hypothetical protein HY600_06820 [Candidatus Omnitrophica bacterium]|nr:hypothetical protein [Candidatus Omnitrophota bacterium]